MPSSLCSFLEIFAKCYLPTFLCSAFTAFLVVLALALFLSVEQPVIDELQPLFCVVECEPLVSVVFILSIVLIGVWRRGGEPCRRSEVEGCTRCAL